MTIEQWVTEFGKPENRQAFIDNVNNMVGTWIISFPPGILPGKANLIILMTAAQVLQQTCLSILQVENEPLNSTGEALIKEVADEAWKVAHQEVERLLCAPRGTVR
jgi:hypothetical protein